MDSVPEQFPVQNAFVPQPILAAPEPPRRPLVRRIFFGPFGLRAGWSLLIYFAILAAIVFSVRAVHNYNKARHPQSAAVSQSAGKSAAKTPQPILENDESEGISFGVILVVSLIMAVIERRRLGAYGLGGHRPVGRFIAGVIWGWVALSLLVGTLRLFHLLSFDAQLDHGWQILGFGAAQLSLFLLVGLLEEYLFRGYIQFTLTRGLVGLGKRISPTHARSVAFWCATVVTSALFFLAHVQNPGENPVGLFLVFVAGFAFVVALWRTGSLWWAIGFHTAWDWSQSFLYGVPDSGTLCQGRLFATHAMGNPMLSGGADGPEGSVFCIPVLLLMIAVLFLFTRPSPPPALETRGSIEAPAQHPVTLEA